MIAINAVAIRIIDPSGRLTKNARLKERGLSMIGTLNSSEHRVAAAMGIDPERIRSLKRKYPRGLVGVALHATGKTPGPIAKPFPAGPRLTSPFPDKGGTYHYDDGSTSTTPPRVDLYPDDKDAKENDPVGLRAPRSMMRPKFPARKK